jgi:hypothetical protein
MFWHSVVTGLGVLSHPQVWIGLALYIAVTFGWMMLVGAATVGSKSGRVQLAGCLAQTFGGMLAQGIAITVYVVLLYPVMLGLNSITPLGAVLSTWSAILMSGVLVTLVGLVAVMVPVVGNLIGNIPGALTFIQAATAFRMITNAFPVVANHAGGSPYPGWLASIGFVLISAALSYVVFLVVAAGLMFRGGEDAIESGGFLSASITQGMAGFLPLFMYAQYTLATVRLG